MASFGFASGIAGLSKARDGGIDLNPRFASQTLLLRSVGRDLNLCNLIEKRNCGGAGIARATSEVVVVKDDRILEVEEEEKGRVLRVGIICGGPSAERGISLNSARSVLDHIQGNDLDVSCYYIDSNLNAYAISSAQMYSNTPADFDFKLDSLAQGYPSFSEFAAHLAVSVDIVFPVIHGQFGEDGGMQELLEKHSIPFVGTGSSECRQAFDKYHASVELSKQGFATVPSCLVQE